MLVFQKQPDGSWKRTGEQLPTEKRVSIAIDADKPFGNYSYPEAIAIVEEAIAKGKTGEHYRYEIAGASAKAKRETFARPR